MAFDLKSATPDTTFPSGGFLFGADSQAATDPSIYSDTAYRDYIAGLANTWTATQTITPAANTNALAVTGYSLTGANAQSLIDLAGTWNTSGTPTALTINVTDTASNSASLLASLQVGGTTKFSVGKDGKILIGAVSQTLGFVGDTNTGLGYWAGGAFTIKSSGTQIMGFNGGGEITVNSTFAFGWTAGTAQSSLDTKLYRGAANTLALANSTNAQTFYIYNTVDTPTGPTNYERGFARWNSNVFEIGTAAGGTGTVRSLGIVGNMIFPTDNTYDIGASGATRPRRIYVADNITTGATDFLQETSAALADGAAAQTGTLTNAPSAGNPTKWIAINDNGTTRYIPTWT